MIQNINISRSETGMSATQGKQLGFEPSIASFYNGQWKRTFLNACGIATCDCAGVPNACRTTIGSFSLPVDGNSSCSSKSETSGKWLDWLQSLKQFFINVSYHILVVSLTLMALGFF